ncbi:PREDICTED: transcription factor MYB1R1 [Camelina sativa]|uniref:Transcription factor MYB1R1 n=1 Tax=Camelina sativa TaxID=90675 RepID=A0ABM0Z8W4_CAMSA|nr:PREDICTED: transcription factor MYB1R1 [Camelina sativa]
MSRSCSQCGNNGHNSRTCPTEITTTGDDNRNAGAGEKGIMLFGVRVTEASSRSVRKTVSMNNLVQLDQTLDSNGPVEDGGGYASDDVVHASGSRNRERKRGTPWTEDEHRLFLTGLHKVGKGDWRGISRNFVKTRTPTQVASHAQKYFLRRTNQNRRRRRSSLFDIAPDSFIESIQEESQMQTPLEGIPLGSKLNRPVPVPIPIPPSRRMAGLNLSKKAPATTTEKMFPLSLNLSSASSSSSSNEQKARGGSRASGFVAMSSNGDSIMGVA